MSLAQSLSTNYVPTPMYVGPVKPIQAFVEYFWDGDDSCTGGLAYTASLTSGICTPNYYNSAVESVMVTCESASADSAWTAHVYSDPSGKGICEGAAHVQTFSGTGSCNQCTYVPSLSKSLRVNCGAIAAVCVSGQEVVKDRAYFEEKFHNWLSQHKVVVASGAQFVAMLQNFIHNDNLIETHNKKQSTYKLGHNQFSHMTVNEWRAHVNLGLMKKETASTAANVHAAPVDVKSLPASVDWTAAGAVTPVKDQGSCGSCWAFSTTGAIEGAYQIKYGSLESFSEQNFVDCDKRENGGKDLGCHGGVMDSAFEWAKSWGGIATEADYPYVSGTTKERGTCDTKVAKNANSAPKYYTDVVPNSDSALMSALVQQPVSIAIEADQAAFQLYKSGVFTEACGTKLDHGVLAVGYGTLDGTDYYKVKNSWGPAWGQDGYILLARGISGQPEGQCGILSGPPSYPNL